MKIFSHRRCRPVIRGSRSSSSSNSHQILIDGPKKIYNDVNDDLSLLFKFVRTISKRIFFFWTHTRTFASFQITTSRQDCLAKWSKKVFAMFNEHCSFPFTPRFIVLFFYVFCALLVFWYRFLSQRVLYNSAMAKFFTLSNMHSSPLTRRNFARHAVLLLFFLNPCLDCNTSTSCQLLNSCLSFFKIRFV